MISWAAPLRTPLVSVFVDGSIMTWCESSREEGVAPELFLTYAIGHEIGHLWGLPHESLGLMQGHWGSREMLYLGRAYLHFNRKQRKRLQAEVLVRMWSHQEAMQNRNGPSTTSKTDIPAHRIEARDTATAQDGSNYLPCIPGQNAVQR